MSTPKKIHLIGIGGIGISALARLYVQRGFSVSGTNDNESPKTLDPLRDQGVPISIGTDNADEMAIPADVDCIVYSDAWLTMAPAFMDRVRALGKPMLSYFEALGEVVSKYRTVVAVSGTHGKTTTTGMIAKILSDAGASPTAVVGSIVADFGSNFLPGTSDIFVVEADEYRKHFLNFTPAVLVINNIEHDHTDFYPTLADIQAAFRELALRVPENGVIVTDPSHENIAPVIEGVAARVVDYTKAEVPEIPLIGEFNRNNARAAKEATKAAAPNITDGAIDEALMAFKGSWRRFEYKGKTKSGALVYDDYAHHPTAVAATLKGVREKFPGKRIIAAFHPHLYSRTRDLLDEFSRAFKDADLVVMAPIFAAREKDDGSVSSEILAERINANGTTAEAFSSLESVYEQLNTTALEGDVIVTMGAGNIYTVAERLTS